MSNFHKGQPWDALIKMANEIAGNIAPGKTQEQTADAMVQHLLRFWSRSMKTQIIACLEMDDKSLSATATQAIELLKQQVDAK